MAALANSCFHHGPHPAHRSNSKLKAAYRNADNTIQEIVDLLTIYTLRPNLEVFLFTNFDVKSKHNKEASVKNRSVHRFIARLGTGCCQRHRATSTVQRDCHWYIVSKHLEAIKKLFLAMGGKLFVPGGNSLIMFPGI